MSRKLHTPLDLTDVATGTAPLAIISTTLVSNLNANLLNGQSNYAHPSGDGNLHVPVNGTGNSGKVLTAGAVAGTYTWETAAGGEHTHGNITYLGAIGTTANLPLITTTSGVITVGSFGTAANTFCVGNDSRLSDARTPVSHAHGNITNTGYVGTTASIPLITGTGGIVQAGAFGTGATNFCVGNDARLSDARTPTSHAHGNITNTGYLGTTVSIPLITGTGGIIQAGAFGTGATDFAAGNHTHTGYLAVPATGFRITYSASAPSSPQNSLELWIDTTNKVIKIYESSAWVAIGAAYA